MYLLELRYLSNQENPVWDGLVDDESRYDEDLKRMLGLGHVKKIPGKGFVITGMGRRFLEHTTDKCETCGRPY